MSLCPVTTSNQTKELLYRKTWDMQKRQCEYEFHANLSSLHHFEWHRFGHTDRRLYISLYEYEMDKLLKELTWCTNIRNAYNIENKCFLHTSDHSWQCVLACENIMWIKVNLESNWSVFAERIPLTQYHKQCLNDFKQIFFLFFFVILF